MIWVVRVLLAPFTLLYACGIAIRNWLYKSKILTRTSFDIPIICVGNISVGGTGKTPHIEWLIRLLQTNYKLAVLSRGYKRKTSGYVFGNEQVGADSIGDEPFQIARKFPDIAVGVSENRVLGIPHLLSDAPQTQVVLMDDGFQHLPIKPGYAIILTDYANLFYTDWMMPSGTLREFRSAYKRANCIIVTKCPPNISPQQKEDIIRHINPQNQLVLFSEIVYDEPVQLYGEPIAPSTITNVIAFSGIAKKQLFVDELNNRYKQVTTLAYADHKRYDNQTLNRILEQFNHLPKQHSAIFTTEKDAVKLQTEIAQNILGKTPVFYLPIRVKLSQHDTQQLQQILIDFIESFISEED